MKTIEITDDTYELLKEVNALEVQLVSHTAELYSTIHVALLDRKKELEKMLIYY